MNPKGRTPYAKLCPHGVLGKSKCRECRLAWEREWIKKGDNQEKSRRATAKWRAADGGNHSRAYMRRLAGIPEFNGEARTGICPLCGKDGKLVPDHDHKTGRVRGWICGVCNRFLGFYEKFLPLFPKFKTYLQLKKEKQHV